MQRTFISTHFSTSSSPFTLPMQTMHQITQILLSLLQILAKTFPSNIITDLSYNLSKYIEFEVFETCLKWVVYVNTLFSPCYRWVGMESCPNFCVSGLIVSGAKHVGNKMPRQIQNFSVCLSNASAKKTAKDLAETFVIHVGNGFGIPWHFAKDCDLVFWQLILLILPILYCLLIIQLNGRNRTQYLSRWSPCLGFFVCPCYNRRTHYPTLEKKVAQNITACKNQDKQRELSDHWK